jgi:tRNA(Ile)-lysidine synthase
MELNEQKTLKEKIFAAFDQHITAPSCTIVVAVSGGADSLALTLLANEYAKLKRHAIEAVTVDHGLRPESKAEAATVFGILSAQNISHHTLVWNHEESLNRKHERARAARYQLLIDFCKKYENPVLMTAHHAQDQAETILMRFLKGSGPAGFQAIQAVRHEDDVPIIRPLLGIVPSDLREYLNEQGITWIEDPSNTDAHYERTRVRQLVQHIKDLGWDENGIITSAAKIYSLHQSLENLTSGYAEDFVMNTSPLTVDQPIFFNCPLQIQQEWLRSAIWTIGEASYPKPYSTIDAVLEILKQPRVDGYKIAGCILNVNKKRIFITKY